MSFWEDLGNTLSEGSTGIFQKIRNKFREANKPSNLRFTFSNFIRY